MSENYFNDGKYEVSTSYDANAFTWRCNIMILANKSKEPEPVHISKRIHFDNAQEAFAYGIDFVNGAPQYELP